MNNNLTKGNLFAIALPTLVAVFVAGYVICSPLALVSDANLNDKSGMNVLQETSFVETRATRRLVAHTRMIAIESLIVTKHVINKTLDAVIEALSQDIALH